MRKKILSFITDGEKFLALRNNPEDKAHGGDFWFTVTGSLEAGETHEDSVIREVKEETNLEVLKIISLNTGSVYESNGAACEEKNYLSFINPKTKIILNEEHIEHKWLPLKEFVELINWHGNKALLLEKLREFL